MRFRSPTVSIHPSDSAPDQTAPHRRWVRSPAGRAGLIFAGSLAALSILAGCGSASTSSTAPASTAPAQGIATSASMDDTSTTVAMIHIDNYRYTVPASVSPGEKVSVMNMDGEAHTVTADSGAAFDDMATAGTITTFTAPTKPGSYPFHCAFHANMHGVLVVK
jgi:plastocyanin